MPWLKLREVIILPDAQAEVDDARGDFSRIDEAIEGLKWLLARNPLPAGSFPTVLNNSHFTMYGWEGATGTGTPDMWVVYSFDDDRVEVHGINVMSPTEEEE
jgi:hypothetical protein